MFVIQAQVKFHFEDEPKIRFAGRDIVSAHSTGLPCWCNQRDFTTEFFPSEELAEAWFKKSQGYLFRENPEISDISIVEIIYRHVKSLDTKTNVFTE